MIGSFQTSSGVYCWSFEPRATMYKSWSDGCLLNVHVHMHTCCSHINEHIRIHCSVGIHDIVMCTYVLGSKTYVVLVGGIPTPLKNGVRQLGLLFPIYGKIIQMFQTNNQI